MSTLQEVLAVLLGAESEAKRVVEEAKAESASLIRNVQDKFNAEREQHVASARDQAKSIVETALLAAQAEADQILSLGREERKKIQQRFDENVDSVVAAVLNETVDSVLTGGD